MKYIDGKNAVLGRLASMTAKELLRGEAVTIINAEKVIITGDRKVILEKYLARRRRGSPQHGPFFPRHPDAIVKRAIRGMLPYKTNKGRNALKNLRVYAGPRLAEGVTAQSMATKAVRSDFVRVADIATELGWEE